MKFKAFTFALLGWLALTLMDTVIKVNVSSNEGQLPLMLALIFISAYVLNPMTKEKYTIHEPFKVLCYSVLNGLNMLIGYYAFLNIDLHTAYPISLLAPILLSITAGAFIHKKYPSRHSLITLILGGIGALIIVNPTGSSFELAHILLFISLSFSIGKDLINLTFTNSNKFQLILGTQIFFAFFSLLIWGLDMKNLILDISYLISILSISALFAIGLALNIKALQTTEDTSVVAFARYSQLIYGAVIGLILLIFRYTQKTLLAVF